MYFGIVGSLASVVGIPLALHSLRLTKIAAEISAKESLHAKEASERAAEEVAKARRDFKLVASVASLERIVTSMDSIKTLIRHGSFTVVPERIATLIQQLNELRSSESQLSPADGVKVQEAIAALRKIENAIDDATDSELRMKRPIARISVQIDSLQPILVRLRESIGSPI